MATDYTGEALPVTKSVTLTNADEAYEIRFPRKAGRVLVQFITNAGEVAYDGDEGTSLGDESHPVAADALESFELFRPHSTVHYPTLYLETGTGGTKCTVSILPGVD
jgi:hypothetical protein